MKEYTIRELRRDKATIAQAALRAGQIVVIGDTAFGLLAYLVPASMVKIETDEEAHSLYSLYTKGDEIGDRVVVPSRMSANRPIPIRFGQDWRIKAWIVPLSWKERLGL